MKKLLFIIISAFIICPLAFASNQNESKYWIVIPKDNKPRQAVNFQPKIQIALLLDTSSSMDGLIDQAKTQLWNIVNTMTTLKYNGKTPKIEIALYEYGNSSLSARSGYIRQVAPLTTDLDLISEYLFSLHTYGGYEYCGQVIEDAVLNLNWGDSDSDMKLIYIAGNEPFTQGQVSYQKAIQKALGKNIYVNTIHCGNEQGGIQGMWRDGAIRGEGKFFNIDHNMQIRHIDTPYDAMISECNTRLNKTYIAYGSSGKEKLQNQKTQDSNAKSVSGSIMAERAVSKSSVAYNNSSWDMVDLISTDEEAVVNMEQKNLPDQFKNMDADEIQAELKKVSAERAKIQNEIKELAAKRQEYIQREHQKQSGQDNDLGNSITKSVLEFASANGFHVEK